MNLFWTMLLSTGIIAYLEIWPLLQEDKKNWPTIILIAAILGIAIILSAIIAFDLTSLPSIGQLFNTPLKVLFPSFYKFMKI